MLKLLRKYPVLVGVAVVATATILRFFGQAEWASMVTALASSLGLVLDGANAPVTGAEVSGAVFALLGVVMKLFADQKKRRAGDGSKGNS